MKIYRLKEAMVNDLGTLTPKQLSKKEHRRDILWDKEDRNTLTAAERKELDQLQKEISDHYSKKKELEKKSSSAKDEVDESLDDEKEFDTFKKKNPNYNKNFDNKKYGKFFDENGKLKPEFEKEFWTKKFTSMNEDIEGPIIGEMFDFLDDLGGYTDYLGRIDALVDEFGISKEEAENIVWGWSLKNDDEGADFDESLNEKLYGDSQVSKEALFDYINNEADIDADEDELFDDLMDKFDLSREEAEEVYSDWASTPQGGSIEDLEDEEESSNWLKVISKPVPDADGFLTDYTMYRDLNDPEHYVFVFGDNDLYKPEDGDWDWEAFSNEEATEWYNSYEGITDDDEDDTDDEDFDESLKEDKESKSYVQTIQDIIDRADPKETESKAAYNRTVKYMMKELGMSKEEAMSELERIFSWSPDNDN